MAKAQGTKWQQLKGEGICLAWRWSGLNSQHLENYWEWPLSSEPWANKHKKKQKMKKRKKKCMLMTKDEITSQCLLENFEHFPWHQICSAKLKSHLEHLSETVVSCLLVSGMLGRGWSCTPWRTWRSLEGLQPSWLPFKHLHFPFWFFTGHFVTFFLLLLYLFRFWKCFQWVKSYSRISAKGHSLWCWGTLKCLWLSGDWVQAPLTCTLDLYSSVFHFHSSFDASVSL